MSKLADGIVLGAAFQARMDNQYPVWNKMQDGGRFVAANKAGISIGGAALVTTNLPLYTSVFAHAVADAGQFLHNNNDFGGVAGAMTAVMVSLQNAIAALITPTNFSSKNKRYGPEFRAARYTAAGAGALFLTPYVGGGIDGKSTLGAWILVEGAGSVAFGTGAEALWINGVSVAIGTALSSADGWKHVAMRVPNIALGYDSTGFKHVPSAAGLSMVVAMPAHLIGDFGGYVWGYPVDHPNGVL